MKIVCALLLVLCSLVSFGQSKNGESNRQAKDTCRTGLENSCVDVESILGILYQQQAAEYRALCYQAYNIAQQRILLTLEAYKQKSRPHKRFAIVTDLDETALDNSAQDAWNILNDTVPKNFSDFLNDWQVYGLSGTKSNSVPGSVAFFNWVKSLGDTIDIFYVSNRYNKEATVDSTMAVMHRLGFPESDPVIENKKYFLFEDTVTKNVSKEARRFSISEDHDIILFLGDNLADFDKAFDGKNTSENRRNSVDKLKDRWGANYIIFPNAVYGEWESALYRDSTVTGTHNEIRLKTIDATNTKHQSGN